MKANLLDRFKGCLFGGAIGDALGYAVEFMNIEQIREQYGLDGITRLQLVNGRALVSDDTQMTLFTANGLLTGMTQRRLGGATRETERYLHNAYMDWMRTQRLVSNRSTGSVSWIFNQPELHSVRAPGGTCLRALTSGIMGTLEHPINSSKGCGGLMRVSPIGLYYDPSRYAPDEIDLLGAKSAALTHSHPLGFISAAALVHIINRVVYGGCADADALTDIARGCMRAIGVEFCTYEKTEKLLNLLKSAMQLAREPGEDRAHIASIGEGWVAEEALAIALYCAIKYCGNFEQALIAAVNHSGDSDSTGAITGSILGALIGYNAIPTSYIDELELFQVIHELADDLYTDATAVDNKHCLSEKWQHKYVKADFRL